MTPSRDDPRTMRVASGGVIYLPPIDMPHNKTRLRAVRRARGGRDPRLLSCRELALAIRRANDAPVVNLDLLWRFKRERVRRRFHTEARAEFARVTRMPNNAAALRRRRGAEFTFDTARFGPGGAT